MSVMRGCNEERSEEWNIPNQARSALPSLLALVKRCNRLVRHESEARWLRIGFQFIQVSCGKMESNFHEKIYQFEKFAAFSRRVTLFSSFS